MADASRFCTRFAVSLRRVAEDGAYILNQSPLRISLLVSIDWLILVEADGTEGMAHSGLFLHRTVLERVKSRSVYSVR